MREAEGPGRGGARFRRKWYQEREIKVPSRMQAKQMEGKFSGQGARSTPKWSSNAHTGLNTEKKKKSRRRSSSDLEIGLIGSGDNGQKVGRPSLGGKRLACLCLARMHCLGILPV